MTTKRKNAKKSPVPHNVLSDRGVHLEQAHQRHQGSNILAGTVVKISEKVSVKVGEICPVCKKKVRGIDHVNGIHHRGLVKRHTRR